MYALSEQTAGGDWINACQPDPDGRRLGFPLPGAFTPNGVYQPAHPGILITCTGGAEGKCVRFGYKPWRAMPDGASLMPYYQACVRLAVAGRKEREQPQQELLHQGLAFRNFQQSLRLAAHVKVTQATLENGLLSIELTREVPEELKPRRIEVGSPSHIIAGQDNQSKLSDQSQVRQAA